MNIKSKSLRRYLKKTVASLLIIALTLQSVSLPILAATSPWNQTDWSGGSGQATWSDVTKYDSGSNVDTSASGQVTLSKNEEFTNTGFETDLTSWSTTRSYSLNDEFTTNRAAGSVNGTSAEPGPGTRTVTDGSSSISVSSGVLNLPGGVAANTHFLTYGSTSRTSGKTMLFRFNRSATTNFHPAVGWADNSTTFNASADWDAGIFASTSNLAILSQSITPTIGTYSANNDLDFAIALRGTGAFFFQKQSGEWKLLYPGNIGSTANVVPAIYTRDIASTVDNVRIPTTSYIPSPLVSDGFSASTTDGSGHAENNGPTGQSWTGSTWNVSGGSVSNTPTAGSSVITNGGFDSDTTWTKGTGWTISGGTADANSAAGTALFQNSGTVGTWYQSTYTINSLSAGGLRALHGTNTTTTRTTPGTYIETNRQAGNAQQGNIAISTTTAQIDNVSFQPLTLSTLFRSIDAGTPNVLAEAAITLTSGTQAGLVMNLDSASSPNNFVVAYHDGVNIKLDKNVNGTYTNLINTATTYVAGAILRVIKDGTSYSVFYNNAQVGTTQTISDASIINNTRHGLFSTSSANIFDNFVVWARSGYTDAPFEEITATRDTVTTYNSSAGSAKLVAPSTNAEFTQSVNVGDTNTYNLSTYAYTDGSAVTSSDLELFANGSTVSTTYTSVGSGWYQLTGTVTGSASAVDYGVRVKANKTVYVDNMSLSNYPSSSTLTSSIFDTGQQSNWQALTYTATTPTNTSISVKVRTSSSADMTGATDFSTCTAITSGSDISSNNCVIDTHRYVQYQLTLSNTNSISTPTFEEISISFEVSDNIGPTINLESPADNSYTSSQRPTFRWKAATDDSGISDYDLIIDNPSIGSDQPSGDFTISDIPVSRDTAYETSRYTVVYEGFSDSDPNNNFISVTTRSSTDWGDSENDGLLREGKVNWSVKVTDGAGNTSQPGRNLFVDRTAPKVEVTQINQTPFTASEFSTTDTTPTIFGKITDPLSGGDPDQTQDENGPRVASGPKQVEIRIEKKEGLLYNLHTIYTINMDLAWWACDDTQITDNTKQKCDKYLPFEYTSQNLDRGIYRLTLTGKDHVDNTSSPVVFTLNVTTFGQIPSPSSTPPPTPESVEPTITSTPEAPSAEEITVPVEPTVPSLTQNLFDQFLSLLNNLGNTIAAIFNFTTSTLASLFQVVGNGLAFIFNLTTDAIVAIFNLTGQAMAFVWNLFSSTTQFIANIIGGSYNHLANAAPGIIGNVLVAFGNLFSSTINLALDLISGTGNLIASIIRGVSSVIAQVFDSTNKFIASILNITKDGLANLAFAIGEKTQDISNTAGLAIIKFTYNFVSEPTTISNVKAETISSTSVKITWETNHPANGKVNWGFADGEYEFENQTDKRTTHHEFILEGLDPDTRYHYEVMSQNKNYVYDANRQFSTPAE